MLIYEVNLTVEAEIADAYRAWLSHHIDAMLALPWFTQATWFERDPKDEDVSDDVVLWTVHYTAPDRDHFERYLAQDAAAMRQDGLSSFPGRFTASRRLLTPVATR